LVRDLDEAVKEVKL
jgi:hypothetical protein